MVYVYAVVSAALVPILDIFLPVLRQSYSLWLVPAIFVGAFLALCLLHILAAIVIFSLVSLKKPPKHYRFYRFVANITIPLILSLLRVRVEAQNDEIIPEDKRFVLICNHTHLFDPLILLGKYPEAELSFLGKKEITESIKVAAGFMWSLKGEFVDRGNTVSGAKVIVNLVRRLKNDEVSVCVFPEGTRSKDGSLGEFKSGALKIAMKSKVPTVVATVRGVTEILHRFPLRSTTVKLDFLELIGTERYETETAEQLTDYARAIMKENLGKTAENTEKQ